MKINGLILKNGLLIVTTILSLNCLASTDVNEVIKSHATQGATVVSASNEDVFTETLKAWIGKGLYWESAIENETENPEVSSNILQSKLEDKSPFSPDVMNEFVDSLKNWIQNGFYWDNTDE